MRRSCRSCRAHAHLWTACAMSVQQLVQSFGEPAQLHACFLHHQPRSTKRGGGCPASALHQARCLLALRLQVMYLRRASSTADEPTASCTCSACSACRRGLVNVAARALSRALVHHMSMRGAAKTNRTLFGRDAKKFFLASAGVLLFGLSSALHHRADVLNAMPEAAPCRRV